MPRARSPERDKAKQLWMESNKQRHLKDIAKELEVSESLVRKWKNQDQWDIVTLPITNSNVTNKKLTPKQEKRQIKQLELDEAELTEKQRLFCLYYIKNFNATQAAIKAGYSPNDASQSGYQLLSNIYVRNEITRLKEMKKQSIMIDEDDIVERYMRIAFADMTDFVEFGRATVPVMTMFGPLEIKNPDTGEMEAVTKEINDVRFKDHTAVDGGLICQIKMGKDGASLKLEDRQKALDWLANFFGMNPEHKHKNWFDTQKINIDRERLEIEKGKVNADQIGNDVKIIIEGDAEDYSQ